MAVFYISSIIKNNSRINTPFLHFIYFAYIPISFFRNPPGECDFVPVSRVYITNFPPCISI